MEGSSRLVMAALLLVAAPLAQAQEGAPPPIRDKLSNCIGCHGIAGYRTAFPFVYRVPRLGGQHPAYIISALKAYRSGDRSHPTMQGIAASLSDEEIAGLAAYYGGGR